MINILIIYNKSSIVEFSADGHSNFDELGKDIVCAAVSAVTQTAVIGLVDVLSIDVKLKRCDGYLKCILPADLSVEDRRNANIVLDTMFSGLKSIQYGYKDYISIEEKEVR